MVTYEKRKSFTIRESGRSTDFIAPSFGFGCLLDCTYCYMKRHFNEKRIKVAVNYNDILTEINNHVTWLPEKQPNQTDSKFWTYDIACNEDFALHAKYHKWKPIFEFFKSHPKAKASLATKIIPYDFLKFNPENKIRIRFSLMPQRISNRLEPNTPSILERIRAIDEFIDAGYDVHINYSPIVVYPNWLDDYKELFILVAQHVENKDKVLSECIFLTHNKGKHSDNLKKGRTGEELLWQPHLQEGKQSEYGENNLRYRRGMKAEFIQNFKLLHNKIIPWNTIRYIF